MALLMTEEEKNSPLRKYLEMEIAPVPEDKLLQIFKGDFNAANALHPRDLNKLFDEGYLPGEFGWFSLEDGGMLVSNYTFMPDVTPEMFDWWFAWHGLDSMRYKIWDRDDHFYCQTRNVDIALDEARSMRERYWHTSHDVKESLVEGQAPMDICLNFVPPVEIGFDPEKYKAFDGTIVCTPGPVIMSHFLRPVSGGSELRTRFWLGYQVVDGVPVRWDAFVPDAMMAKALLMHNVKEFTHLAKILPEVYGEFKDRFVL